jgi:hypothetical protein
MQHSDSKALATDARTDINKALRQLAKGPPKKGAGCDGTHFTCFYWYKSTNTATARKGTLKKGAACEGTHFTCLYWYKSTFFYWYESQLYMSTHT